MAFSDDDPQIGGQPVDRAALDGPGVLLAQLASELGAEVDAESFEIAPADGWRVVRHLENGQVLVAAPVDDAGADWRIAFVNGSASRRTLFVHPDTHRRRPSRAERRRGLEVRWPMAVTDPTGARAFAVDIVNTGTELWLPTGDSFQVIGVFTEPGVTSFSFGFGDMYRDSAMALAPGDYARVPVTIPTNVWDQLEPGRHDLHAVVVHLGLQTTTPLAVDVTEEVIASHRRRDHARSMSPDRRRIVHRQIRDIEARIAAGPQLAQIAESMSEAETEEDAVRRVAATLDIEEEAAQAITRAPLRDFLSSSADVLRQNIQHLTRSLGTD
jgi:hypothetical protein